ncbi:hypothetical protein CTAYLR_007478 [Chrysophaeum taylorii]|uniref:Adenosine kinase n=1 Tax=Chrysophaeum taylorii TaxID=2483200 RepID=A0AAD7UBL9_9STRA|nr:hypothetical protein CTAYLR_007478 [Chrysophaeum taylorii]
MCLFEGRVAAGGSQTIARVAHPCSFVGCVGRDGGAEKLRELLCAANVQPVLLETDRPTARAVVLKAGETAAVVVAMGAALCPIQVPSSFDAKLVYVDGVARGDFRSLGEECARRGVLFGLGLNSSSSSSSSSEFATTVMPYVDLLIGNGQELLALLGGGGFPGDAGEAALAVSALPKARGSRSRIVVITRGTDATILVRDGTVSTFPVSPVPSDLVADLNGAGDAFVGGFLRAFLETASPSEAILAGHDAARFIIQQLGTQFEE